MAHSHILDHSTAGQEGTAHAPASGTMPSQPADPSVTQMVHLPLLHAGVNETFLFSAFTTSDGASFALACILLVVAACLLELMRLHVWYMEDGYMKDVGSSKACSSCASHHPVSSDRKNYNTISGTQEDVSSQSGLVPVSSSPATTPPSRFKRYLRLLGVGFMQMQVYQVGTAAMLVAMTMNIYFILALSIGSAIGKVASLRIKEYLKTSKQCKPHAAPSASTLSTHSSIPSWRPTFSFQ